MRENAHLAGITRDQGESRKENRNPAASAVPHDPPGGAAARKATPGGLLALN